MAALLLRYLSWWQAAILAAAAILFNIRLLKLLARGRLHRPHEREAQVPAGLVLYPTSILILLLFLPSRPDIVAAAWGILAFGDGAATLAGRRFGVTTWPWNRQKSVVGSAALFVAGGVAGSFLAWWCQPAVMPPPYPWFPFAAAFAAALVAAAVETVPIRLDDNLSVPLAAAATLWTLSLVNDELAVALLRTSPARLAVGLPANLCVAWIGYRIGSVSRSGAIAGILIGTLVFLCTGWAGWVLLLAAFGCAALTSRIGLRRKTLLGIAEERGGRRGAPNAIANTAIATVAGFLSVVSYGQLAGLIAFTAALTAGASDTVSSEIGKAWGRGTWAILPPRAVPPGTPGAMSLEGTVAGLIGTILLAVLAIAIGLIPGQMLFPVVAGATAGSLVESLLAAAFEGQGLLNNHALNLINTAVAAFVAVSLAGSTT
jgi:uncharacterized protein (TIGR00297 family)